MNHQFTFPHSSPGEQFRLVQFSHLCVSLLGFMFPYGQTSTLMDPTSNQLEKYKNTLGFLTSLIGFHCQPYLIQSWYGIHLQCLVFNFSLLVHIWADSGSKSIIKYTITCFQSKSLSKRHSIFLNERSQFSRDFKKFRKLCVSVDLTWYFSFDLYLKNRVHVSL